MTVEDLDVVMRWEEAMFGTESWSRSSYLEELADTDHRVYLVAESAEGQVLGDAGLLTLDDSAQILTVGVDPQARRRGIGRILLRALLTQARLRGAAEVLLEVRHDNHGARALYQSEGFQALGTRRGYYENGRVDALTMRLELSGRVAHDA